MLRWHFNGEVPVVQINERGRFQGFADPGMKLIKDRTGLYVAREPDHRLSLWDLTTARREPLERVDRVWRGMVMDTYALEKLTGWTPELSPSPVSPLFRWRVLAAGEGKGVIRAARSVVIPAIGSRERAPDDRLRPGIQYAAVSRFNH
jgi:hypothetical protein